MRLIDIARRLDAELPPPERARRSSRLETALEVDRETRPEPEPEAEIEGLAALEDALPGQLSFFADNRYERALRATRASAVILAAARPELPFAQLIHPDPMRAFLELIPLFHPPRRIEPGIHASAVIAPGTVLAADVFVGPTAVIEAGTTVGAGSIISAGCYLGADVTVGEGCQLHPRVTVLEGSRLGDRVVVHSGTVIGADGYGYRWDGQAHRKVPQVGRVVIEDDVEIGANCAIDRAALGETVIGAGSKLDNLVHVGHNVQIGRHCLIIAQVGLSGSVKVGRGAILAGQVGVADHSVIGDGAIVVAQSGVHGEVAAGAVVAGSPIMPHPVWRKVSSALPRLPDLIKAVRKLERGGS